MKQVLILGGSGYIGRHLYKRIGPEHATATFNNKPLPGGVFFDAVGGTLADLPINPDDFSHAVILLGHTNPDFCAKNPNISNTVNVTSIKAIIDQLNTFGIKPVFASTEVVFDGQKGGYVESDSVNPTLVYGRQKVEVEEYLKDGQNDFLILRIAKAYDSQPATGSLLGDWFHQAAKGGEVVRCAEDFISSAIHVDDITEAVVRLIERNATGIYHLGGPTALSRLDIFNILVDEMKSAINAVDVIIEPCSIHDFPTIEPRPLNVSMGTKKLLRDTNLVPQDMASACRDLVTAACASPQRTTEK